MQGTRSFTPPTPCISIRHNLMGLRFFSAPAPGGEGGTPPAAPAAPTPTPPATPPATPVVTPPADDSPWNDPVAAQKEIERLRAENAKDRTGAKATAVKDIAPTDSAALKAAIEKALTDNPRLKTSQVAGKSGGDLTGGTGETSNKIPLSLEAAVKAALTK